MRRKQGALTVLEQQVLDVLGDDELHGYEIAQRIGGVEIARRGSIYKALVRLAKDGRLTRRWDTSNDGAARRLYRRTTGRGASGTEGEP